MSTIADLPDTPRHTIKHVCIQTGIQAVTLRAWERRYHVLKPRRTGGNYRLYSDRDIAVLRWLKIRVDSSLGISRAAAELTTMRAGNDWPAAAPSLPAAPTQPLAAPSARHAQRLFAALTATDKVQVGAILLEVMAQFDLAAVCLDIIQPCLEAIGEARSDDKINLATEYFARHYLRGWLLALFQCLPLRPRSPRIVVGCAPGEFHELGSLMLALFLRRDGYRVDFLGANVHLGDLLEFARAERPALICLSANSEDTARELRMVQAKLAGMRPRPKFAFGGRIFSLLPKQRESMPGLFLGPDAASAQEQVRQLLPI
jgi:methanogenic corrinoid protein MtbC1